MTDARDLLAAIVARPDDDLPRLVYADFLDETGDPDRAEFIRVQCELAGRTANDPFRPALAARERVLLAEHERGWRIPGLRGPQKFRRGFVEVVHTAADWLLDAAGRVLDLVPVRQLRVSNADPRLVELAECRLLARVERLELANNNFGITGRLERFFDTARLDRLRSLGLRNNRIWSDGVRELAGTPVAARLERLDISGNPVGSNGLGYLADAVSFAGLRELAARSFDLLYTQRIKAEGAAAVANSFTLRRLRRLDLAGHEVGDAGLMALARSSNLARLEELDLSDNDIGAIGSTGVEALTESPHLGRLRAVNLGGNHIDQLAAVALAGWPRLAGMAGVDLRGCEFGPGAAEALAASGWRPRFLMDG